MVSHEKWMRAFLLAASFWAMAPALAQEAPEAQGNATAQAGQTERDKQKNKQKEDAAAEERHRPPEIKVPEVAVTATRSERSLAAIPGSVTVITRQQIEEQMPVSKGLGDMLGKLVPGMAPSTQSLSIFGQGLRGRNALIMIDGVPQSTSRNVFRELVAIDPAAVERIEVVRGATAIYGDGATGGIINIITRKPGVGPPRLTTDLSMNTAPTNPTASLGGRIVQSVAGKPGAFDYTFSGTYERFGGLFDAASSRIPPDPNGQGGLADANSFNLLGKVGRDFGLQRLQLSANHYYIRQDTDYTTDPIVNTLPGRQKARAKKGLQLDEQQGTTNTLVNLDYHHKALLGSRVHGQVYYRDILTRFFPFDGRAFASFGNSITQSRLESEKVGGRLETESPLPLPLASMPRLLWGLDLAQEKTAQPVGIMDSNAFDNSGGLVFRKTGDRGWAPQVTQRTLGLFGQLEWQALDPLLLRAGLRHEFIEASVGDFTTLAGNQVPAGELDYSVTLPNAGVVFSATPAVSLFASYAQGFSLVDLGLFLRNAPAGFNIASLRPEAQRVNHYETGIRGEWRQVQSSLAVFYNKSEKGTSFSAPGTVVIAPEKVYGIEGTADTQPFEFWRLGGTASWTEGETKPSNTGDYTWLNGFRIPPIKLTAYVEHDTLPQYQWRNRVQVLYVGDRDRFSNSTAFGNRPVEGYVVVDLLSSLKAGPGTLRFGIENLLNNEYFPVVSQLQSSNSLNAAALGMVVTLGYAVTY